MKNHATASKSKIKIITKKKPRREDFEEVVEKAPLRLKSQPLRMPTVKPGDVECIECGHIIPPERLRLVKTEICVNCMEMLERRGKGTVRHTMEFEVEGVEEVESISMHLRRSDEIKR